MCLSKAWTHLKSNQLTNEYSRGCFNKLKNQGHKVRRQQNGTGHSNDHAIVQWRLSKKGTIKKKQPEIVIPIGNNPLSFIELV